MRIKTRVDRINKKITALIKERDNIQEECEHKDIQYTPRGDSGNWDRNDDSYWYEITCLDCGKRFSIDQNRESYEYIKSRNAVEVRK